ncbi:DUF1289 domain-containing protein [Vibrio sp. RE86]|uniref:DUF1289 domain-containing protein n=1 Tax=Vibrio sp. RE86 TaxID=2607605 RepID=UPI0034637135
MRTSTNPCIGVCQASENGQCLGCGRTRTERYQWYQLSEVEQREILSKADVKPLSVISDPR